MNIVVPSGDKAGHVGHAGQIVEEPRTIAHDGKTPYRSCAGRVPSATPTGSYNVRHDHGHWRRRFHRLELQAALVRRGRETVVVDRLGQPGQVAEPGPAPSRRRIFRRLTWTSSWRAPSDRDIYHLGAISDTTASDGDQIWGRNVELPERLWRWCAERGVRMIYASSAATYGDGTAGFDDDYTCCLATAAPAQPLWLDQARVRPRASPARAERQPRPPQWVGLKFFNVYGPNEYHKGRMISVIKVKHDELAGGDPARLFRSTEAGLADGEQKRDFIWVGDVIDTLLWLMDTPGVNGLFNLGTGQARSYLDHGARRLRCCRRAAHHRIHRHA